MDNFKNTDKYSCFSDTNEALEKCETHQNIDHCTTHEKEYNDELLFDKRLLDYIEIDPMNYIDINCWQWIRYINKNQEIKKGGVVLKNNAPNNLIIMMPYGKYKHKWTLNLDGVRIFMKKLDAQIRQENIEKENLYKLYKAGYVVITEKPNPDLVQD